MTSERPQDRDRLQQYRKSVRIFGIRKGKFLEFEFTMGHAELTIELVMPYGAFKEFCESNHVVKIDCDARIKTEFGRLSGGQLPKLCEETNIINLGDFK